MISDLWTITDETGAQALEFTSFIDIDARDEGQVLSYPVEEGGFMSYNKTQASPSVRVTLATQGTPAELGQILEKLKKYRAEAIKLTVITPRVVHTPMTLESYTDKSTRENGASQLTVELVLIKIREVRTQVTTNAISRPKNATSANRVNTGKTQSTSVLATVFN